MKGQRDLSSEMAPRFARACGLVKREAEFFCELVSYCQAKTTEAKQRGHEALARFRKFREAHELTSEQTAYHACWYMPAVRELASLPGFREDPKWIARILEPPITDRQAAEALETLCRLGLLVRDEHGKLRQAQALLTTGSGPLGHQIFVYHRTMLDLAKRALDHLPRDERDISSLTLCLAESALPQLKRRIVEFRRELLQMAELTGEPERVVQLNFQMFPLSRRAPKAPAAAAKSRVGKEPT